MMETCFVVMGFRTSARQDGTFEFFGVSVGTYLLSRESRTSTAIDHRSARPALLQFRLMLKSAF
jgi:hypothetical protein